MDPWPPFVSQGCQHTVSITLSMLTTFLSEEDEAFMAMLDCLRDEAQGHLDVAESAIKRHAELTGSCRQHTNLFSSDRSEEKKKIDIIRRNMKKNSMEALWLCRAPS